MGLRRSAGPGDAPDRDEGTPVAMPGATGAAGPPRQPPAPGRSAPPPGARTPGGRVATDPSAVVGDYVVLTSLGRDRLGEVCRARGPAGEVRLRLARSRDPAAVIDALGQVAALRDAAIAPILDRLSGPRGAVAVVTPADPLTLAERRRLGPVATETAVALGPPLLDGLATLHAAGLAHGAVSARAVGIDERGHPRWHDCCLTTADQVSPVAVTQREDVRRAADLLRDLGTLPEALGALADEVATGARGAAGDAAGVAASWRSHAAAAGIAVPAAGSDAVIPELLAPARGRPSRPPPSPRLRRGAAALLTLAGVAVIPVARAVPGGGGPFAGLGDYLPAPAHHVLVYAYVVDTGTARHSGTVRIRIDQPGAVAGVETVSLVQVPAATGGAAAVVPLPLGLGGATLRRQGDAITRTAVGGAIRDLVAPLQPGRSWTDRRDTGSGFGVDEARTLIGAVDLDTPAGSLSDCAVVVDTARSLNPVGAAGATAQSTAWYCPGVGLARAVLSSSAETDELQLTAVDP